MNEEGGGGLAPNKLQYERCFVKSYGWFEKGDYLHIAMEYLVDGDLHDHLLENPPLPEEEGQATVFQLIEGLKFMHENRFAHRDLKPAVGAPMLATCPFTC